MKIGQQTDGFKKQDRAYNYRKKIHGNFKHDDIATSLNNLGLTLYKYGKREEASNYLREALEMNMFLFKDDNPKKIMSLNNLANLEIEMGYLNSGLEMLEKALQMNRKIYRVPQIDQAHTFNNIGSILMKVGKPKEALAVFEESKRVLDILYPNDDINKLVVVSNIAQSQFDCKEYRQSVDTFKKYLGMIDRLAEKSDKIEFLDFKRAAYHTLALLYHKKELKNRDVERLYKKKFNEISDEIIERRKIKTKRLRMSKWGVLDKLKFWK